MPFQPIKKRFFLFTKKRVIKKGIWSFFLIESNSNLGTQFTFGACKSVSVKKHLKAQCRFLRIIALMLCVVADYFSFYFLINHKPLDNTSHVKL